MNATTFDALARDANALRNRRNALRGIGLGALVAAANRPSSVEAGKERKKTRKRIKKKCKRQIDACRASLTDLCNSAGDCEEDTLSNLLACCPLLANCKAGASLDCFFSRLS